jgi:PAS domain S-box-containing protein
MTGLGPDDALGEGWIDAIYPEDRQRVLDEWAAAMAQKQPVRLEYRLGREGGKIIWVLGQAHAIYDNSGSIAGYTGTVTDITERIEADHALRESEVRFRQLFHSVPNPISLTRLSDGRFLDVNDAFTESIGWSREEVIGKTSIEIGLWLNEAERETMMDKIRAGETIRNAEIHLRIRTGEIRDYLASVDAMQLDGTPCLLVASTDVTKQLQAVSLLKRHNRLLNTLSAVNELLLQESDAQRLFEEICRVIVEKTGFRMAWIGIADLDQGTVTPVAEANVVQGYLSKVTIRCDDSQWGQGPTGTAIRENRTVVIVDTDTDPRYGVWRETAREYGFRSSAAIPIRQQDRVFGCLNIYSKNVNDFGPDELPLLERMSADLGFVYARLEMQKRLQQSEVQLKAILDHSPALISIKDSQGNMILANRRFEILDLPPPEQLIGKNIFDLFPQDVAESLWASLLTVQNAGTSIEAEETFNHRDGTVHTYLTIKFPVALPGEAPFGICALSTDITEYKKSQKALEESENRLASFFSEAPAGLVLFDKNLRFLQINPTLARNTGNQPEELIGKLPSEILPPELAKSIEGSVSGVLATGEADINREVIGFIPDDPKTIRHWMHTHFPITDTEGHIYGVGAVVVETTAIKKAEEALMRLNQELETRVNERTKALAAANAELESFAYSVSHDLRAPLRAIDGFSRILLEDYEHQFDAEGRQHMDRIIRAIHRMGALIDALLALSRLNRQELRPQNFSSDQLTAMVREIIHEIEMENSTQEIDWQMAPLSPCYADLILLRQVWSNLLHNAAKYSRHAELPKVQVGMLDQGGEKIYFVRDNGVGFDMNYADKLFGVFQRLHRQDEFEGTGIGLATVKRIVGMLGGRVWADSEVGKGATFYFTLP